MKNIYLEKEKMSLKSRNCFRIESYANELDNIPGRHSNI